MGRLIAPLLFASSFACGSGERSGSLDGKETIPAAGELCDHTRTLMASSHGAPIPDSEWPTVLVGCIRDFEKKRGEWGDSIYEEFLVCSMRAKDITSLAACNETAKRRRADPPRG